MTRTALTELAEQVKAGVPSSHTGAGDPIRSNSRIINGHFVTVKVIGWGEQAPIFEIDKSIEALSLTEAVERVA